MKTNMLTFCLCLTLLEPISPLAQSIGGRSGKLPARSSTSSVEIDDQGILDRLARGGEELLNQGKTVPMTNLIEQLQRKSCSLKLPPPPMKKMSAVELAANSRNGVLVVAGLYKSPRGSHWHAHAASGFVLNDSGAFATSYHVVNKPHHESLLAMTDDGKIHPVIEVLAADELSDLAILRMEGSGFTALPLAVDAPVGTTVSVFSHPDDHFYMFTQGIVARHYTDRHRTGNVSMMSITADFAKGSSGAPVLNEYGAVVGMVDNTDSLYYTEEAGKQSDLQMVFKNCVCARHILELIRRRE